MTCARTRHPAGNDDAPSPARSCVRVVGLPPAPGRVHVCGATNAVLDRLTQVPGAIVPTPELIGAAYGDRPDGGPTGAASAISSAIRYLRRRGYAIEANWGRGYRLLHGAMARCLQRETA